jgi:tetratricopeptide (TPR) repeat protein
MRINLGIFLLAAAVALPAGMSFASGGGPMGAGSQDMGRTTSPEESARHDYNAGVRYIKKAQEYDSNAATAGSDEKKRSKALAKSRTAYAHALDEFNEAVSRQPGMYQAWNYIGFANRHLGNYDVALSAYARALELNPTYPEAIEYRGEAYLSLDRIDDAKGAYMTLFRDSRSLADQLMSAMRKWSDAHLKDPQGLPSADVEAFSKWMDERAGMAAQTASLAIDGPHVTWR